MTDCVVAEMPPSKSLSVPYLEIKRLRMAEALAGALKR